MAEELGSFFHQAAEGLRGDGHTSIQGPVSTDRTSMRGFQCLALIPPRGGREAADDDFQKSNHI